MPPTEIRDLTVRFGRRTALSGISADLDDGVLGLLGPNGAGKSTLLRALATLVTPTSGSIRLLGRTDLREIRRRLGYLPQEFGYYPRFTAREFVEHFAWLKEVPAAELPLAVDRALTRVGLADRADEKLKKLSGGMRRRVGIAQAIVNDPELLLLDEPTAGLDPEQQVELRELLRELGETSCVVLSTHVMGDAGACDQIWVLESGRPLFRGAPDELGSGNLEERYHAVLRANRKSAA
ncbi:ABC-2 type transport system ATP-binding protein [Saccharopolyspora kobensis]|uniref:ABC-2 type transport system ATP-binding protein n=1 Tax=Saccharopolyspora kobensis TaxID=146035 RepID=A0A1H6DFM0_9PSEU|nr:ABC transporter ATP-binding protein [Saccharopolyspora kobensis]SEG84158.1 ABC-2 type transport system ATP-binding protein [Saccharopolyspora kobensis]SFD29488.1 ABC-2 type transport system ATP-binding protein [Saccharopolyspora kobensis]